MNTVRIEERARGVALAAMLGAALVLSAVPGVALAEAAQPVPVVSDVPADHWAYRAVLTLVQRGYIRLEAGRFDGSRPVDRYTLASIVASLLQDIESGKTSLSKDDLQLVRQLTGEFREELARWQQQRTALSQRLDSQAADVARVDAKLSEVLAQASSAAKETDEQLAGLGERVSMLEQASQGTRTVTADLQDQLAQLRTGLEALTQGLGQGRVESRAMLQSLGSLQQGAEAIQQELGELESLLSASDARWKQVTDDLSTRLSSLGAEVQGVKGSLELLVSSLTESGVPPEQAGALMAAQQESLKQLEGSVTRLDQLAMDLDEQGKSLAALRDVLVAQQANIERLREQNAAYDQHVSTLQSQLQEAHTQLQDLRTQLQDVRNQAQASEQARATLEKDVDTLRANVGDVRSALGSMVRDPGVVEAVPPGVRHELDQIRSQNRWLMAVAIAGLVLAVGSVVLK